MNMKKHLLFLSALLVISACALAQSTIQLIDGWNGTANNQTYDVWEDTSVIVANFDFDAKNIGTATKKYMLKREEIYLVPGSDNYICWAQCYAPMVTVSLESVTIVPNDSFDLSSVHYRDFGNVGTSTIRYIVYDSLNVNDSAWFIVNWHATGVGIDEANAVSANISAYPNPAVTNTTIKYELNGNVTKAALKIYNLMGEVVKEIKLNNTSGSVAVNTSELDAGIYFYAIIANDKTITTRKLVVAH